MRLIGTLPDPELARRFGDYLLTQSVPNTVERGSDGWGVWVHDENQVEAAGAEFGRFRQNPADERYRRVEVAAAEIRQEQAEDLRRHERNQIEVRRSWQGRSRGMRPVTTLMVGISLAVGFFTKVGTAENPLRDALSFSQGFTGEEIAELFEKRPPDEEASPAPDRKRDLWDILKKDHGFTGFEQIREGEVWRLFTPIFLHFGILHLLFNMFWLYDLGGQIERTKGAFFFVVLVLLSAGLSDVAQNVASGPRFGGMSGVNYALFGYIWMKQRFQPLEGLGLAPNTVPLMLIWLVLCMAGAIQHVANTAHVVGLGVGVVLGVAPHLWSRLRR